MPRKNRYPDIERDISILKSSRVSALIDYLHFNDSEEGQHLEIEEKIHIDSAVRRKARIDNVTAKRLASFPEAMLDCELTLLEFSIDFRPKRTQHLQQHINTLIATYELILKRLAPWTAPHISPRIGRSAKIGQQETLISGKPKTAKTSFGTAWLRVSRDLRIIKPKTDGKTIWTCHTMYFGQKVNPSWPSDEYLLYPRVQVKVYIKVTDHGQPIESPKNWRTRMEVTLNGPALEEVLGVKTFRDLQTANLQPLASLYLRLARPVPLKMPALGRKFRKGAVRSMVEAVHRRLRDRDVQLALQHGNFTQAENGLVAFKTDPVLTSHVRSPVREFTRARDRYLKKRGEIEAGSSR